jgi:hypothetical protein
MEKRLDFSIKNLGFFGIFVIILFGGLFLSTLLAAIFFLVVFILYFLQLFKMV